MLRAEEVDPKQLPAKSAGSAVSSESKKRHKDKGPSAGPSPKSPNWWKTDASQNDGEELDPFQKTVVLIGVVVLGLAGLDWVAATLDPTASDAIKRFVVGGGSGGNDGGVCDQLPTWFCTDLSEFYSEEGGFSLYEASRNNLSSFRPLSLWLLFLGFLAYLIYLLFRLPLLPRWTHHASFGERITWSPLVIFGIFGVVNFAPELLKGALAFVVEGPRAFAAYTSSLAGLAYTQLFKWTAPTEVIKWSKGRSEWPIVESVEVSRPIARYCLTILAYLFAVNALFLLATMIPSSLELFPTDQPWYRAFWPFDWP